MIWPDWKIKDWARNGGISPYNENNVNPASIDLSFSGRAKIMILDQWQDVPLHNGCLVVATGELYLLDTLEYVRMPADAGATLMLKSSMGRIGLEHLHAGWFDPDFHGTATLEIVNLSPVPIVLEKGRRIVQLVFHQMLGRPDKSYKTTGRYNGQNTPQAAKL